jgi:hypothetical protein
MDLGGFNQKNEEWGSRFDQLCQQLDNLNQNLREFPPNEQQHSPAYNQWERYVLSDGVTLSGSGGGNVGGGGTNLRPAPPGWEAYVTTVAVTVSGASAAATIVTYNGDLADLNLVDYSNQMFGNTPSRAIAFYDTDIDEDGSHSGAFYVENGDSLTYVIAGAVANATAIVRVAGVRRQT